MSNIVSHPIATVRAQRAFSNLKKLSTGEFTRANRAAEIQKLSSPATIKALGESGKLFEFLATLVAGIPRRLPGSSEVFASIHRGQERNKLLNQYLTEKEFRTLGLVCAIELGQ